MAQLKLMAVDAEDLQVISACCQDAVMRVSDVDYRPSEARFIIAMNRFAWEKAGNKSQPDERRKSVLHFEKVLGVKTQGINPRDKDTVLSLLSVSFSEKTAPSGTIELTFAGDGAIALEVECIEAQLGDLSAAWEASSRPNHEAD